MTLLPNRVMMTPQRELDLARGLLEVQSEEELDRFLPLLALAAPLIGQVAGPLLKNVAGSLFGGGGKKRRRPRDEQQQFMGKAIKGLFSGQGEAESYEEEQFIGGVLKGVLGGETEAESYEQEQEQERFIRRILKGVLGGETEAESYEAETEAETEGENEYIQEQFIAPILKGLLGRETELESEVGHGRLLQRARKFVKLVHLAAQHAATEITNLQRAGHRPDENELRRIVVAALVNATRRLKPRLAAAAFGREPAQAARGPQAQPQPGGPQPGGPQPGGPQPGGPQGPGGGPGHGQSMLEMMIADATPLGGGGGNGGLRARSGHATWRREGNRMVITL